MRSNFSYQVILLILFVIIFLPIEVSSQSKSKKNIESAILDSAILNRQKDDSIRIEELILQVQELKLNEILLRNEHENRGKETAKADSIKRAEQRKQIDSLRIITPGVPIVIEGDTLFSLYSRRGGVTPADRAAKAEEMIMLLGKKLTVNQDSVYLYKGDLTTDIMSEDKVIMSVTDQDGLWQNLSREELAEQYLVIISQKIQDLQAEYGLFIKVKGILLCILVVAVQIALIYLTNKLFKKLQKKIIRLSHTKFKGITIKDYEILTESKERRIMVLGSVVLKYIFILIQLMITIPILFSIFPETEKFAYMVLSYIWIPAKDIFMSVVRFIPSVFKIILIYICFKYIIRGIKYIANEIATDKLKINGFYADWAFPTYYIVRFLLYSFMLIMIWPLLPGSKSPIFQGVSVFIGLIISLGSTTVIGNLMAGMVITYMRPFRIGDQIKLNDTTGFVIEKTPFVTRIRTPKNEIVTIPNSFILSSQTVNYSVSAQDYGIILHSTVTVGYETPWKEVQQLLIEAACETSTICKNPSPFVLVQELSDFYCTYQINAYSRQDQTLAKVYSELHRNIIDKFNEAGIELMSPHFYAQRDGSDIMMPPEYINKRNK
ncbi:mechanosensitive ion channel family protein [Dysgonomonas sp. Marseille-P4677]|uniref:mechanosensitive ion channel family protein n=1 Tax=Dysgonomonas sp. Marseille-P4677 TaxID=2364790 RepID=UPI0019144041|nr:mechanosensitive ion channel family protein [Dysgonomonas sp. Marseille-P4677]MBK5721910.1 mechanosensitive ion channel family protein [Dysgonomonas sp. Marseille-P4677]